MIAGTFSASVVLAVSLHIASTQAAQTSIAQPRCHRAHRQLTLATEPAPTTHLFDCESVEDTAEIEHLLITTKSWGAYDAIQHIQHRLTKRTVVVAMMNGMQHVDDLKPLIPKTQLFLASTTAGVTDRVTHGYPPALEEPLSGPILSDPRRHGLAAGNWVCLTSRGEWI